MKAYQLSRIQVANVTGALFAEVAATEFSRQVGALLRSACAPDTPLGEGGFELGADERAACLGRAGRFFGMPDAITSDGGDTLGAVADRIIVGIETSLRKFSFTAAGGLGRCFEHPADRIFGDAAALANLLYGRRRIVSLVAPHSLVGFSLSVLAPNLLGLPALDGRGLSPEALRSAFQFGDAVVATPSLWRYLIAQGVTAPDNAMAVTFGEALSPELSAAIRKAGYGAQREIYGSTESGLVGWRDTPSDPFALFEFWRRENDTLIRLAPSGEEIAVEPMDFLIWEGERRFRLGGRRDGAVQIGGVNAFPDDIAARISDHPEVSSCKVTLSRHPDGMDRLVAAVTLKKGAVTEPVARSIDAWCRSRLRPHERPRVLNFIAVERN
jgi:4-coumarate--CoA ligase (photoactive yellow protein activation family)